MWDLSSSTRDQACVPCIGGEFLTTGPPGKSPFCCFKPSKSLAIHCGNPGNSHRMVKKFHSSVLLPPSLMTVLGTGQTPPCPEAREQRNGWAVTSRSASGHRAGWGVGGGWLQVENKPNQLCFRLPIFFKVRIRGGRGSIPKALEKLLPQPLFPALWIWFFHEHERLGAQLALQNCVSDQKLALPWEWSYNQAQSGMCMLKKVMMYTLKAWGTINLKCWSNSFVSRQMQVKTAQRWITCHPSGQRAPRAAYCSFQGWLCIPSGVETQNSTGIW